MNNFFDKIMFNKLIKMHGQVKARERDIQFLKQDIARIHELLAESTRNLQSAHDLFMRDIDPKTALSERAFNSLMFKYQVSIGESNQKLGIYK